MKMIILLSTTLLAVLAIRCQAVPVPAGPFADEKADRESLDVNEVGPPEEDWTLYNRLTKTQSFDPSDSDKTRALVKEIEDFSRLVAQANATDRPDDDGGDDAATTTADEPDVTESDSASTDWFASTWRTLNRKDGDGGESMNFRRPYGQQEAQETDGGVEDIIRKISNDLKKLYIKLRQAITVIKTWVNSARGSTNEFDGPYPMSASASESDGVFVIADRLVGDIDKSNKYTVPINAAD